MEISSVEVLQCLSENRFFFHSEIFHRLECLSFHFISFRLASCLGKCIFQTLSVENSLSSSILFFISIDWRVKFFF